MRRVSSACSKAPENGVSPMHLVMRVSQTPVIDGSALPI
jgi:hypothetical protein